MGHILRFIDRYLYFTCLGLAVLFTGLGLYLAELWKEKTGIVLSKVIPFAIMELGIAIAIALVLIATIERYTQKRHLNSQFKASLNYNLVVYASSA